MLINRQQHPALMGRFGIHDIIIALDSFPLGIKLKDKHSALARA